MRVLKTNVLWSFAAVLFLTACQPSEFTDLAFPQPPSTSTSDSLDALIFEPTAYDFGDVRESSGEGTTQISVENDGSSAMYLRDFESSRDDFEITSSTTALTRGSAASVGRCTVNLKLNAGQSCTLDISFVPSRGGDISGNITVTYANALTGGTTDTQSIGLTGTGIELLDFDGLDSIAANDTTVTSTVLRWDIPDGVDHFKVYSVSGGTPTLIATLGSSVSSYSVTGLSAGTLYQYRVNAFDVLGVSDGNTTTRSVTTKTAGSFSVISAFTMAEAATGLSGALSCSDAYGSTPTYTINSETDGDVNCSIVSSGGQKVSCTPDYKTGHSTWTSTVQVNCALNGVNLTRDVIVTVTDTDRSPVSTGVVSPTTFDEDTNTVITLGYSDADGDLATACATSNLGSVSAPVACACAAGTCTVTLKGSPQNYYGAADFDYNVTAYAVQSNTSTNVALTIVNIPEPPEATGVVSPTSFDEDTQQIITLEYTDVDAGIATACSVGSLTNVTVTQACACASGTCTVGLTGTTNYFGAGASFTYTVTTNSNNMTSDPIDPVSLTINAINDAPTISDQGNTSTDEDVAKAVNFTIGDVDDVEACNSTFLSMTSTDTNKVANSSVVWSGTAPNCTATITPEANANGTTTITFIITDGSAATASDSFVLTLNPINDNPVVAAIADTSTDEDTDKVVSFSVSDIDGDTFVCDDTHFSMTSSDTNKVANASVVWSGTSPNCVGTVTPAANANGNVNLTFTLDDQNGGTGSDTFQLTLNAVNDAPTISNIADTDTDEDVDKAVNFTIEDIDGDTLDCSATYLSMGSTDTGIVDSSVVFSGTAPTCTATITPEANANGNTTITLTVDDQNGETAADSFVLTVDPINDNPTISDISNTSTDEDNDKVINFTISDVDGDTLDCTSTYLAMSSSSTSVIANASVVWSGSLGSCTATISPVTNANGAPTITFTLDDELGGSTTDTFVLTVTAVNDAPTISDQSNTLTAISASKVVNFTIGDVDNSIDCSSTYLSMSSSSTSVIANASVVWGGSYPNCTATITPQTGAAGAPTITLTVSDGNLTANDTFLLTVTTLPTVSSVVRSEGRLSGGQILVIYGENFSGSADITLINGGGANETCTSVVVENSRVIQCTTPAGNNTGVRDLYIDFTTLGYQVTVDDAFTYYSDGGTSNPCDAASASMSASGFQSGAGTVGNPYWICTNTQWNLLVANTASQGTMCDTAKYLRLGANLDISGLGTLTPICNSASYFVGEFDGDANTADKVENTALLNMSISSSGEAGTFRRITSATVKNLNFVDPSVVTTTNGQIAGIVVAATYSWYTATVNNVNIYNGNVGKSSAIAGAVAGGIIGSINQNYPQQSDFTYKNGFVWVTVNPGNNIGGGIAAYVGSAAAVSFIVQSVKIIASITSSANAVGGVAGIFAYVGQNSGRYCIIDKVIANVALTSAHHVGGLVGFGGRGFLYISDALVSGTVTVNTSGYGGGLIGSYGWNSAHGTDATLTNYLTINNAISAATVSGSATLKGALVGWIRDINGSNTQIATFRDVFYNSTLNSGLTSGGSLTGAVHGSAKTTSELQEQDTTSTYSGNIGAADGIPTIYGTANQTSSSTSLTNVSINGIPYVGQLITGTGIPTNTTVTAVTGTTNPFTLTISAAATTTATGNAIVISSSKNYSVTADQTNGSTSLTNFSTDLTPFTGQKLYGTGITSGQSVSSVSGSSSPYSVTISANATSTATGNTIIVSSPNSYSGTADLTNGVSDITNVYITGRPAIGQYIKGTGIPDGTTITAISGTASPFTLTLSAAPTTTASSSPITLTGYSGYAARTSGSTSLTSVYLPFAPRVGDSITGVGIPAGATIVGVTTNFTAFNLYTLTISASATSTGTWGAIRIYSSAPSWNLSTSSGTAATANMTAGSTSLTSFAVSGYIPRIGDRITGEGIQAGTYVTAVSSSSSPFTVTLSLPATATTNGEDVTISSLWKFMGAGNYPDFR